MDFFNLDQMDAKELVPGMKARFIHSEKMTFAYWDIAAGASLPEHSHPHEQVANVIEGEFSLTVNGETKTLGPGSVVIIPPHATHSGKALRKSRVLDVFHPVREDYR